MIMPPAYSGKHVTTVHDPARIDAFVGSRVRLTVHAQAAGISMETIRGRDTLVAASDTFLGELIATPTATSPSSRHSADGHAGVRRLIGITIIPDAAPKVRIALPGRDLFFRDAHQTIDLAIEASDDLRLASLRLRYTKVSGSGERFTFTEGEVPLNIVRDDARTLDGARALASRRPRARRRATWSSIAPSRPTIVPAQRRPNPIRTSRKFSRRAATPRAGFALDPGTRALRRQPADGDPEDGAPFGAPRVDDSRRVHDRLAGARCRATKGARRVRVHDGWRARRCARSERQHHRPQRRSRRRKARPICSPAAWRIRVASRCFARFAT